MFTDGIPLWCVAVAIMSIKVVKDVIRIRVVVSCALRNNQYRFVMVKHTDSVVVVLVQDLRGGYGVDHAVAPTIVPIVQMVGIAGW